MTASPTAKTVPAQYTTSTGASRRLRALTAVGWDLHALAAATGINNTVALNLLWDPPAHIPGRLHTAIAQQYRRLITETAPAGTAHDQAVACAAAADWAAPGEWDDIDADAKPSRTRPEPTEQPEAKPQAPKPETATVKKVRLLEALVADLRLENGQHINQVDRMATEQRRTDRALKDMTDAHDRAAAANTAVLKERIEIEEALKKIVEENQRLIVQNLQHTDDLATNAVEFEHLRSQITALGEVPGHAPRVGELTVEQDPDGTTRINILSRKKAHVTFGGVDIDIPALTGRIA